MAAIRTFDGRLVDPLAITAEDVIPSVIIHSISTLNRFTGHAKHPYSVGQHTLNLVRYVPLNLQRAAMIHDWSEAWFNDLSSPLKAEMPQYKTAEKAAGKVVASTMGVSTEEMELFDVFDKAIYVNERNALFDHIDERGMGDERRALPDPADVFRFNEMNWRYVRGALTAMTTSLFPEWSIRNAGEY